MSVLPLDYALHEDQGYVYIIPHPSLYTQPKTDMNWTSSKIAKTPCSYLGSLIHPSLKSTGTRTRFYIKKQTKGL